MASSSLLDGMPEPPPSSSASRKLPRLGAGALITALLVLLCTLALMDLWRQYAINHADYWFLQYTMAVRSGVDYWKLGFRLEDLEKKLEYQRRRIAEVKQALATLDATTSLRLGVATSGMSSSSGSSSGSSSSSSIIGTSSGGNVADGTVQRTRKARLVVHRLLNNETKIGQIRCGDGTDTHVLRVGLNDFRTDTRDVCGVFVTTSSTDDEVAPHNIFEMVPLDGDAFGFRYLGNDLFLQAVPPPSDASSLPWKIVVGGPVPGAAERFRYTEDGYLYSPLMGGMFTCRSGEVITGFPYANSRYSSNYNKFKFQIISDQKTEEALELVHLSDRVIDIQSRYTAAHKSTHAERKAAASMITGSDNPNTVRICVGIPMTSKGTKMKDVKESPLWTNFFDSFMKSIDWRANRYVFRIYLGLDKKDDLYDTGDAWSEIREEFRSRTIYRMKEQLMETAEIEEALEKHLTLKLMHFDHLEGSPTQVVSQLMLTAYVDNYDYFYQVNDDTIIVTPNWATKFIETLAGNPSIPNFGVTGPTDTNNDKIFTHSFVHRTHIEVFGHLFPPSFKNWWSDDWITTVYGTEHTFRVPDVQIKHNVGAQKEHGYTRYEVDKGAQLRLDGELRVGHAQIDQWLKKNSLPRLPLPNVCGYVPLVRHLTKALRRPGAPTLAPISAAYRSDAVKKAAAAAAAEGTEEKEDADADAKNANAAPKTTPISEETLKKSLGWSRRW